MGAAIAITAFPMLARIIYERKLAGTALGTLALAAGAIDDAAAWIVLAVVLASFGGGVMLAIKAVIGGSVYAIFMLTMARKWLQPIADRVQHSGVLTSSQLLLIIPTLGTFGLLNGVGWPPCGVRWFFIGNCYAARQIN